MGLISVALQLYLVKDNLVIPFKIIVLIRGLKFLLSLKTVRRKNISA